MVKKLIVFAMVLAVCLCATGCRPLEISVGDNIKSAVQAPIYYAARQFIPAFTIITEDNFSYYFEECGVPIEDPLAGKNCVQFLDKEGIVNPVVGEIAKPFVYGMTLCCDMNSGEPLYCYKLSFHPLTHVLHKCTSEIIEMSGKSECFIAFTCKDLTYRDFFFRHAKDIADTEALCEDAGQEFVLEMNGGVSVDSCMTFWLEYETREDAENALRQDCIAQIDPSQDPVFDFSLRYGSIESPVLVFVRQRASVYSSEEAAKANADWEIFNFVLVGNTKGES